MQVKKIGTKIAVLLILIGAMSTQVFAFEKTPQQAQDSLWDNGIVTPYWTNITDIFPAISSSGQTLYPEAYIEAKSSSAKITGTMYLEKYSSGRWTRVASWSISGTGYASISKSHTGTAGTEYRTRVVVTVGSESAEAISGSCSI
ncbi:MAG: hypothetical protein ACK5L0_01645 [Candidatus Fimivivens sp.]